jgi:hypothetical protein
MIVYLYVNATLIIPGDFFKSIITDDCTACPKLKLALIIDLARCLGVKEASIRINIMTIDEKTGDLRVEITVTATSIVELSTLCASVKTLPKNASALDATTEEIRNVINPNAPSLNISTTVVTAGDEQDQFGDFPFVGSSASTYTAALALAFGTVASLTALLAL